MNLTGVAILLVLIVLTLWVTEKLGKKGATVALLSRKLLHVVGVGSLAIAPIFFSNHLLLAGLSFAFFILLLIAVNRKWLVADIYNRPSWGIALFPLSFFILWMLFGEHEPWLVMYPMLVLTFADAGAAIIGGLFAKRKYNLTGDEKSYLGSAAFAVIAFIILAILPIFLESLHPFFILQLGEIYITAGIWIIFPVIALIAAGAEGVTSGGWDNVTVPLLTAWLLAVLADSSLVYSSLPVLAALSGLGYFAWKKEWLNAGGSVTAVLLGFIIWVGNNWPGLGLIAVFFISGSLLGKLNKGGAGVIASKSGKPRDYKQVLCNGGVAGACLVWYGLVPDKLALTLFAVSVAISTADTLSSEIGMWAKGKVIDIIGFKVLPAGISGGISVTGTLAGLAGAAIIAILSINIGIAFPIWVTFFGFLGMLADSVLGSLIQVRYRVNNQVAEEKPETGNFSIEKGVKWMDNDLINLFSNLCITILAGFLLYFCA
jgi:uncharacterized protein (TIGR00297 family)